MAPETSRRSFIGIAAGSTVAATVPGLAAADSNEGVSVSTDFESMSGDWYVNGTIPEGATYGAGSGWNVALTGARTASGSRSCEFSLDATEGHGMLWIERPVSIEPGTAYEGTVSVEGWNPSESYNDLSRLRAYVGPQRPTAREDFPTDQELFWYTKRVGGIDASLWETSGWKSYESTWETPAYDTDRLWLAVGVASGWETDLTHYLDDVTLDLEPL